MTEHDDEFDDFLARRRKLFRRSEQDVLEPPHEVDRIVLRQAREAIETRGEPREIRGMAWGAPLALAASLLVAFTIILNVGVTKKEAVSEVKVEQVAQRRDYPPAPVVNAPMAGTAVHEMRAESAEPAAARNRDAAVEAGAAGAAPAWRNDAATWLAEIQRLRSEGRNAEADTEMAEFKRQHKAYAGSPDR